MRKLVPVIALLACSTSTKSPDVLQRPATKLPAATPSSLATRRPSVELDARADGSLTFHRAGDALTLVPRLVAPSGSSATPAGLERRRGELTEIVAERPDGVELSWRFESRPAEAIVRLVVEGGTVLGLSEERVRVQVGATTFRIGHGTWIDARGIRTRVPVELRDGDVVYAVPAALVAASSYPAVLDPTVSAEVELDAPTLDSAPGASGAGIAWDGTQFVYPWSNKGIRVSRITPAGALVEPFGAFVGYGYVLGVASSGADSLVVYSEQLSAYGKSELRAVRIGKDGKLIDTTPLSLDVHDPLFAGVGHDGSSYVVVSTSSSSPATTLVRRVGATGVVSLPDVPLPMGPTMTCVPGTCLVLGSSSSGDTLGVRLGSTGALGSSITIVPASEGSGRWLAADGAKFIVAAMPGSYGDPFDIALRSVSTAGTVGAPQAVSFGRADMPEVLVGNSGELLFVGNDATTPSVLGAMVARKLSVTPPFAVAYSARGVSSFGAGSTSGRTPAGIFGAAVGGTLAIATANSLTEGPIATTFDTATAPTTSSTPFRLANAAPSQRFATIASDGTSFLATWLEQRAGKYELRSRRYDAAGKALDAAPHVLATSLTPALGPSGVEQIDSTFDGTRFVVDYRISFEDLSSRIERIRIGVDGVPLDATPDVVARMGYDAQSPTVAGAGGRTTFAWPESGGVYFRRFDAAGVAVDDSPVFLGSTLPATAGGRGHVAISSDGARELVSWPVTSGASTDLVSATVSPTGAPGAPFPLVSATGSQRLPASASDGKIHLVAWVDQRPGAKPAIHAVRVDASTATVLDATPALVLDDVDPLRGPVVRWDGGAFVVAAARLGTRFGEVEIALARVRADGVVVPEPAWSLGKEVALESTELRPALASDGKGTTMAPLVRYRSEAPYASERVGLVTFVAKHAAGTKCSAAAECDDGNCVDGVCCRTACTGACEACDVAGSLGVCTTVAGRPHGARSCGGASGDACSAGACDGTDGTKCASLALAVGAVCGAPSCAGASYSAAAVCSSSHVCVAPSPSDCAPYRCGPLGCLKTCTTDDQCEKASCVAGSCVPSASGARCGDGNLTSVAADGTITSCSPYRCDTDGACAKKCTASDECVPGFVCDTAAGVCSPEVTDGGGGGGCAVGASSTSSAGGSSPWIFGAAAIVAWRRRRRLAALAALAALAVIASSSALACRSSEEAKSTPPIAAHHDALKVGAETSTTDSTDSVDVPAPSAIACHATGCLVVQKRSPWVVGQRLDATGKRLDANGFVIAPDDVHGGIPELAVGTNGTDYLVVWRRFFEPAGVIRVSGSGAPVGSVLDLVPASTFGADAAVGWDGKNWLVVWRELRTGKAVIMGARFASDGARLDPVGFPILSTPDTSIDGKLTSLSCDATGCDVGATLVDRTGKLARVEDGKVVGAVVDTSFPVESVVRDGAGLVYAGVSNGPTASGALVTKVDAAFAVTLAPSRFLTDYGGSTALGHLGTALVGLATHGGVPGSVLGAFQLDAALKVVGSADSPPLDDYHGQTLFAAGAIGTKLYVPTGYGMEVVTASPLAVAREELEHRAAPHRFSAVATDGTSHFVAFARASTSANAILVAKTDGGTLTPPAGTLVATESAEVKDVAMTWDGAAYVVVWVTDERVAFARVDATGAVLDTGGIRLAGVTTVYPDPPNWSTVGVGVGTDGAIAVLGGTQVGTIRLRRGTNTVLDATARTVAIATPYQRLTLGTGGGKSVFYTGGNLFRVAADGTIDPTAVPLGAAGDAAVNAPSIVADGASWLIAYDATYAGSLGADVKLARYAGDLGGAPDVWTVSARDADQLMPTLTLDGTKAMITWVETVGGLPGFGIAPSAHELRTSWVDLAAKRPIVDAVLVDRFVAAVIERVHGTKFAGDRGELVYGRFDSDPSVLSPRIKSRTVTFDALPGATCTKDADCELGPCVDGVCCNTKCDGTCEACDVAGSVGTCTTVAGKPHGARACATGSACAEAVCDGFEPKSCQKFAHAFETKCAEPKCDGALFTSSGYCDGKGACAVPTTASCAPYACDANGCLTSCASDASCAKGFSCKDHLCVAPENGAVCVNDGLGSKSVDGTVKDCSPFRCDVKGTCAQTCDSAAQCAPGFACDPSGQCVSAVGESSGGCVVGSGPGTNTPATAAFGLAIVAALGLVRARRRR